MMFRAAFVFAIAAAFVVAATPRPARAQVNPEDSDRASEPARSNESAPSPETEFEPAPLHQERRSAADFAGAPRPGSADNLVREDRSAWWNALWVPRVVLFVPRWVFWAAMAPVRGGLWAVDRYQLIERYRQLFFNEAQTFGIFPSAFAETGFGINVGLRLVHRDLFGENEELSLRGGYGGRFRQVVFGRINSGTRFGSTSIELAARYEVQPDAFFFGYGNADEPDPTTTPAGGFDPLARDAGAESRFEQTLVYSALTLEQRLGSRGLLRASGAYRYRSFDDAPDRSRSISMVYDVSELPGYAAGISQAYSEVDIAYDTRRSTSRYVWANTAGYRANAFAGYAYGLGDDPSRFARVGVDVSALYDIVGTGRILALRFFSDSVIGKERDIPFVDLPRLGGPLRLRGYDRDRFRDRLTAVATIEYRYPLSRQAWAYLFTDIGRVYSGFDDLEPGNQRVGYGLGLEGFSLNGSLARAFVASSIDGDLFVFLSLNPTFELQPRTEIR